MLTLLIFFLLLTSAHGEECQLKIMIDDTAIPSGSGARSWTAEMYLTIRDSAGTLLHTIRGNDADLRTGTGTSSTFGTIKTVTVDCAGGTIETWDSYGDGWDAMKYIVTDAANDLPIAGLPEGGLDLSTWRYQAMSTNKEYYKYSFPGANGKRGCMDDTAVNYDADAVVPVHCVFTTMLPNTKLDGTCLDGYIIGSGQEFDARNDIDKFTIFWLQGWNYPINIENNQLTAQECQDMKNVLGKTYYYTSTNSGSYPKGCSVTSNAVRYNNQAIANSFDDRFSYDTYIPILNLCMPAKDGCTDISKSEYDPDSTNDVLCDTSGSTSRCTDPTSITYNPGAVVNEPDDCVPAGHVPCAAIQTYLENHLTSCILNTDPTAKTLDTFSCGELKTEFNLVERNCDCA
tara:strand:+ start:130 stop:1332 length:1203 start_codon:yes stop_codon:yes gene_type:complete